MSREFGVSQLFRGCGLKLLAMVPSGAVNFLVYDTLKQSLKVGEAAAASGEAKGQAVESNEMIGPETSKLCLAAHLPRHCPLPIIVVTVGPHGVWDAAWLLRYVVT